MDNDNNIICANTINSSETIQDNTAIMGFTQTPINLLDTIYFSKNITTHKPFNKYYNTTYQNLLLCTTEITK